MQVVENSFFIIVTFQARPCLNDTVFGLIQRPVCSINMAKFGRTVRNSPYFKGFSVPIKTYCIQCFRSVDNAPHLA